ncbi:MAG: (2Fe-2S)-binding protein [Acidobacteriota bacterium]|nr:(2Fe-2S)-binding protein [Acidobacteriota bacterium]
MSTQVGTSFETFLNEHDRAAWAATMADLLPEIHEVDRNATEIWFAFFPLALLRALEESAEPEKLAASLLLKGKYYLKDQIDSSHTFLYGHRYWPQVKKAVVEHAESNDSSVALTVRIRAIASRVAAPLRVEQSLVTGITAVALMTLQQVGLENFKATPGAVLIDAKHARKSPTRILKERAKDDGQGVLGFLRTTDKVWTVRFNENDAAARFRMIHMQEVASAAATDKRDWYAIDERCTVNEGPIPVQCRSASCGTCWVGVLGGAEKLTPVAAREGRKIKEFGYVDTEDPQPLIRLACQAQGTGALSIVIPPWNGVFGKHLREQ